MIKLSCSVAPRLLERKELQFALRIRRDPFLSRRNLFKKSHKGCRNCVNLALKARKLAYRVTNKPRRSGNAKPTWRMAWLGLFWIFVLSRSSSRLDLLQFFAEKPPISTCLQRNQPNHHDLKRDVIKRSQAADRRSLQKVRREVRKTS